VTADLVRQALQEQTAEQTVILSASAFQRLRVFVVVPLDVKDGVLEAEGLQRALASVIAAAAVAAAAMRRSLRPARRAVRWSLSARASPPWRRSCGSGLRGWEGRSRCGSWRSAQRFYVRRKLVRWVETRAAAAAAAAVSLAVVAAAMDRLSPSPDGFHRESGKGRDPLANVALK
jgi:hypothetical protein